MRGQKHFRAAPERGGLGPSETVHAVQSRPLRCRGTGNTGLGPWSLANSLPACLPACLRLPRYRQPLCAAQQYQSSVILVSMRPRLICSSTAGA
ncbi:hypothetical protein AAFF_G00292840 [Aldrovandia affinis]|uniref:Uncharacterized protein n=1 Tax=Aldrovandia affinis TaxID=143900 RepID=A0AAD7WS49_9TELE|nr:hypothetical protein AAFF_G00292840 [Aldrovandia affinis]